MHAQQPVVIVYERKGSEEMTVLPVIQDTPLYSSMSVITAVADVRRLWAEEERNHATSPDMSEEPRQIIDWDSYDVQCDRSEGFGT